MKTRAYKRATEAGRKVVKDPKQARALEKDALQKLREHREALDTAVDDLRTLIRLVKAYADGDYREIPVRTIVAAAGAVIYFVSPIDAIPDAIPVAGYFDDVAVILLVVDAIHEDLGKFRAWEDSRPRPRRGGASAKKPSTARKTAAAVQNGASKGPSARAKATAKKNGRPRQRAAARS